MILTKRKVMIDGRFWYGYTNYYTKTWIIEPRFEEAEDFEHGLAIVKVNGRYGFINEKEEWVINPDFEGLEKFNCGMARSMMNGKWGFIDINGEWVIPPQFDSLRDFSHGMAVAGERVNSGERIKYGYIDMKGNWAIPPAYDYAHDFLGDRAFVLNNVVSIISHAEIMEVYIDRHGRWITAPEYTKLFRLR